MPEKSREPDRPTAKARVMVRDFYDNLEKRLKRFHPQEYAPFAASRLIEAFKDPEKLKWWRPHHIMHSIEANCAYWKSGYRETMTRGALAHVMNAYVEFCDPLQLSTISESLDRWGLMMRREQMELQKAYRRNDLMRTWRLFIEGTPMPRMAEEFESRYGVTPTEWLQLSYLTCAAASMRVGAPVKRTVLDTWDGVRIKQEAIDAFFRRAAHSPQQIKTRYEQVRAELPLEYHSLIRTVFFETPLIDFDNDTVFCPLPALMMRFSWDGIYRLGSDLPSFADEFGRSFEKYVGTILGCYSGRHQLLSAKELAKGTSGKHCDYLLETDESIVVVECKATSFTPSLLTDSAIENTGCTGKVAKGLVQIYTSAADVGKGVFDGLLNRHDKPMVGIIATFGDIPSANSDWFFERFFMKRAGEKLGSPIYPSNYMARRPMIISIRDLEHLVALMNAKDTDPVALYDEKMAQPYHTVGDWDAYIESELRKCGGDFGLRLTEPTWDDFFRSLGVSDAALHRHGRGM